MSLLGRRRGDTGDQPNDTAEDAVDHPWLVPRRGTPPVIGWYDADTGDPYPYYYTGNEIGPREPTAVRPTPPPSTVDLPAPVEQRWTDGEDGTEVRLTM